MLRKTSQRLPLSLFSRRALTLTPRMVRALALKAKPAAGPAPEPDMPPLIEHSRGELELRNLCLFSNCVLRAIACCPDFHALLVQFICHGALVKSIVLETVSECHNLLRVLHNRPRKGGS